MPMNEYVGYGFTALVCVSIALFWRRPKLACMAVLVGGMVPVAALTWVEGPFQSQRGLWMFGVIALALVVYIGCTAQLALSEARRK